MIARADGGEDDVDEDRLDYAELWDQVGRGAASRELARRWHDTEGALEALTDAMAVGEDPSPEQLRAARWQLNELRRVLEQSIAPAAGCEPWDGDLPPIPRRRVRETWSLECCDDTGAEDTDE